MAYWFWIYSGNTEIESNDYDTLTEAQAAAGRIIEDGGETSDIYDDNGNEYPVF